PATPIFELKCLRADHLVDCVEKAVERLVDSRGPHSSKSFDEKPVTRENRGGVSVDDPGSRGSPPQISQIDDIVVQERRVMHELDCDREVSSCPSKPGANASAQRNANGSQSLSPEVEQVARRPMSKVGAQMNR